MKNLKNNVSRDNEGYINELFKPSCIGSDLLKSIHTMLNRMKTEQIIPILMLIANVTTIPKSGSKLVLSNERGIFKLNSLRGILMRILYNRHYDTIDKNMSECNIGGRRGRGCRDNIFIINAIIHDVNSSQKKKPVLLQIYDYAQMFDAIHLKEAICDLYDIQIRDDTLGFLYEANKKNIYVW